MGIRASKYGCIISFLYIKPQLPTQHVILGWVVLYRFSTSNHNYACSCPCGIALYYIVSLHQTTTARVARTPSICCIISFLYIKPQPQSIAIALLISCIISFLYIKPQRPTPSVHIMKSCIISFLYIKPQHYVHCNLFANCCIISFLYIKPQRNCLHVYMSGCCIISFLYIKPQLIARIQITRYSCIISFLYIKPQLGLNLSDEQKVVLYRFSTSNHNYSL